MSQIKNNKNEEFVKTNHNSEDKAKSHEFGYWKSLKDISSDKDYNKYLKQSDHQEESNLSRRNFLSLVAASVALASLEGCKKPVQKIIPYVEAHPGTIPGIRKEYATTMPFKNNVVGLVIENHDERPIKVFGNDNHPTSLGKSNVFSQASILDMYDPDRARGIKLDGKKVNWSEYIKYAESIYNSKGKGLAVLLQESSSPTMNALRKDFKKIYPNADWIVYEPINNENLYSGVERALGKRLQPYNRLEKAKTILSIGSDFLGSDDNNVNNTRKFSENRRVEDKNSTMNRLYVVESSMTATGASADHRLNIPTSELDLVLKELCSELKKLGMNISTGSLKTSNNLWIKAVAEELMENKGSSIILGGSHLSVDAHAIITMLNDKLNAPVDYYPLDSSHVTSVDDFVGLCKKMKNGSIENLIILGGNPVYNAPADLKFESLIKNVQNIVHLSNIYDETSKHSNWHIAESHFFENWGDAMSYDGYPSVIQPQIRPLFQSHTAIDLLIPIIYGKESSSYDFIREVWKSNIIKNSNFEKQWNKVLHDGVHQKPLLKAYKALSSKQLSTASLNTKLKVKSDKFEVVFIASPSTYDGRYANNGWLQEVPKPITQLTWDNAALISMSVAKKLKIKNGQMLEISLDGKTMSIPAWIVPGQNKKTITIELGYGRDFNGRIGNDVGFNAYKLRTMSTMAYGVNASIKVLNKTYPLAGTQDHYGLEEDSLSLLGNSSGTDSIQQRIPELVRQSTLDHYKDNPNFVQDAVKSHKPDKKRSWADHSMYNPEPEYDYSKGQQWGMSIDLTSCTGCNACSISCQSENNIPIVGKQQVLNGREMHWIRIDNYFSGDPENPEVSSQSVACVHCELAPCEQVCPVAATTHSSDGVNQMTYNRCLGTRYCANNCPYKVRKFNFYNFTKDTPEIVQMAMNPDVTVRFRGVMEKCSYCYQRVSEARIKAENEHREMVDGDVKTACQDACPADAIVFGDINDPNSRVSKAKRNNRDYALLGQLGTSPRTTYLAKIRNQNPKLITNHNVGAHH
tara:strand:- start:7736 stop:10819 length:3084 start_codon:yes stop_codon:yes gene_type:complete